MLDLDRATHLWLWPLAILAIAGCGNKLPTLTGKITLDGNPPPADLHGTISFQPMESGLGTAFAQIRPDGSYVARTGDMDGIKAGRYKVRVAATIGIPSPPTPQNPVVRANYWAPLVYNDPDKTPLEVEIKPGRNVYNIEMVSKP